jgi:hypothetical protein
MLGPKNRTHGSFGRIDPGWSVHLAAEYDSNKLPAQIINGLPARIITLYPQISALAPPPAAEAGERATTKFYLRG